MIQVTIKNKNTENERISFFPSESDIQDKRQLTDVEKQQLIGNKNRSSDPNWNNIYVSELFDPNLIAHSEFVGTVVFGNLQAATLKSITHLLQIMSNQVVVCQNGQNSGYVYCF